MPIYPSLNNKDVDHIIGGHVLPSLEPDKIGIRYGAMAAHVEKLDICLKGPGGHTSRPEKSVDLVWAQSHLVISLEESIKHHLNQREPVVLAFGQVSGGHTCNVLPSEITLKGTLRYLNTDLFLEIRIFSRDEKKQDYLRKKLIILK